MRPRLNAITIFPVMDHSRSAVINGSNRRTGCAKALLTHSCTSALDLAALLLDIEKRRRSYFAILYIRIYGKCLRPARRNSCLCRYPRGHA